MAKPLVLVKEGGEDQVCIVDNSHGFGGIGRLWRGADTENGLLWCGVESLCSRGGDGGGECRTQ